jgi:hypothetical protein
MTRYLGDEPLDELNDPHTAQVLLGDNPSFRQGQRELVQSLKERIRESGDVAMVALLPELDRALEAYMADPRWVAGPGHVQLMEALRPLLLSIGVNPGNFGLL